eukprot:9040687-Pyramimonas_sp.AAC.1
MAVAQRSERSWPVWRGPLKRTCERDCTRQSTFLTRVWQPSLARRHAVPLGKGNHRAREIQKGHTS